MYLTYGALIYNNDNVPRQAAIAQESACNIDSFDLFLELSFLKW
jgi:hypothetical protein